MKTMVFKEEIASECSVSGNGELVEKTDTTTNETTLYDYDVLGNLKSVTLPDGTLIEYVIDPANRRAGKKVNGVLVQGWLYEGITPVAELDASGNVVARFVPGGMIKNGVLYKVVRDHLGSPRLVVNASTGAIAQRMDFDEWGNVLLDTAPGFTPFGFAGGLWDTDTGLVRFGARDYDPQVGRWTARDPIGFEGGDSNLYGYVAQNPINSTDPNGMKGITGDEILGSAGMKAWLGGAGFCTLGAYFVAGIAPITYAGQKSSGWQHCYASCLVQKYCGGGIPGVGTALGMFAQGGKEILDFAFGVAEWSDFIDGCYGLDCASRNLDCDKCCVTYVCNYPKSDAKNYCGEALPSKAFQNPDDWPLPCTGTPLITPYVPCNNLPKEKTEL